MRACIIFVHNDPGFAEPAVAALQAAGYDVVGFQDSTSAICALERPKHVKLLITRVRFPSGMPNGVALACMARLKQPGIKVLFTSFPEVRQYTDGVGEILPRPLSSTDELLETVGTMLYAHPNRLLRKSLPAFRYHEAASEETLLDGQDGTLAEQDIGNGDRYRHEQWPYFLGGRR
jgi:DNA-binding NtrC family response regulator